MSADDDDVEIVHLQKGAVRIILPPAGFDRPHEYASTDDFSISRPLSLPSAHNTIILPTTPNAYVSSSGRGASGNETVFNLLVPVPQKTSSDRFSHQSTTVDAVQSKTEAQDSFHGVQDQRLNLPPSEHRKEGVNVSIFSSQYKQDSTGRRTEEEGMGEKKRGDYVIAPLHSDESSALANDDQKIGEGGVETKSSKRYDHRKYNTFNGILDQRKRTTVTALPTGATRIVLKHSVLQREREHDYQHSLDSETARTAEDTRQSMDPNNNQTEDEGFLFSHLTFDCLEDVQVCSENEEQITHLLLTADTVPPETDQDLQHSDYHTGWKQSSRSGRVCPTTDSGEFARYFDTNRNFLTGSSKHGQRLADNNERIPEERYSPFIESTTKSEKIFPTPRERLSSDQKIKQVESRISPSEAEDTGNSGGVDAEENSDSECVFSGHTYSRAMWRSTSAEASHLSPSFSSRTPLHEAFCPDERERSGSTSSYEEWRQSSSFFSVLPWTGKTQRMRTKDKRFSGETEHASLQSTEYDFHQNQMQIAEKSDTDYKNAGRYLEATLALAESEQAKSKSSSDHIISGEMGLKDLKRETSNRPKHVQKRKMAITKGNHILSVIPNSKTHPTESTHIILEAAEAEEGGYPCADKEDTLNTNSTGRGRSMHPEDLRFPYVTSLPPRSSQSSSELSSSDSHRSASVTPEEKGELESSSTSSADSVHTIYFVPENTASVDTSLTASAKRPAQISQSIIQKNLVDHSSSGPEVSDVDERSRKKRRLRLTGTQQGSTPPQAMAKDRDHLWEKPYKGKTKPTVGKDSQRLPFVDEEDKPKPAGSERASFDHSRKSDKEKHDVADKAASDTASIFNFSKPRASKSHQAAQVPEAMTRASSLSSSPDTMSVSESTIQDSDAGQKTSRHSCSSSNDLLTSESEIGPLVSFPRKTVWGGTVLGSVGLEPDAAMEEDNVTAVEIRRRYSSEEYVPASPFASHLKRHPSNLSDGAAPLFLQRQRSRSRSSVRQVSLDIGEEWESVQSPTVSLPPMSPVSPLAEDESVFFGPGTAFEQRKKSSIREYIPLEEMTSDRVSKYSSFRKKSHQTSAKLRMLYPNPADPRCFTTSEDEQRSLMSTLTRSELSRLQQAGSPLLRLLKGPKKDSPHKVKKIRTKQERLDDSPQSASTAAMEYTEVAPIEIDPRSDKPVVTVQPMPQIQQEPSSHASPVSDSTRGGDVAIAMSSSDVRMENMKTLPPYKRRLLPNPFNRLNQRCHSTLQCPCCFFFCFLCCSPALILMKWSDYEFDYGSWEKARTYGRRTTVLYVIGAVVAVCFVVSSIVATVIFLQESLLRRRGWS